MVPDHDTDSTPAQDAGPIRVTVDVPAPNGSIAYAPESTGNSKSRLVIAAIIVLMFFLGTAALLMTGAGSNLSNVGDLNTDGRNTGGLNAEPQATPTAQAPDSEEGHSQESPNEGPGVLGEGTDTTHPSDQQVKEHLSSYARRTADDPVSMGSIDAPVVIVEYADFTCPYCAKFAQETMPSIVKDYVNNGLVRIEWRDLPLFGDPSAAAALGGRAAAEQGMFWEYQEAFYAAQIPRDHVNKAEVIKVAQSIGVPDMAKFEAGFTNEDHFNAINRDFQEAQQLGVQSTPTFLVNGEAIMGAESYESFKAIIDQELKSAE